LGRTKRGALLIKNGIIGVIELHRRRESELETM